ncbi:MAG: single-stranded DNA-binding protein [Clostridiales bacterium]|nr:single-stranded DNA-binding protein [Clostridiales bacterium]
MNKIILIGRLTRDPELSTTTNGVSVCRMSLAVTRRFTNSDGERETDFFNIVVWRALGETCHKFLKKGSQVAVIGSVQNRSYDAQDGSKRYTSDVVAEEVEFIGSRSNGEGETYATPSEGKSSSKKETAELEEIDDDSLPF